MNVLLGISLIFIFGLFSSKVAEKIKTPAITAYLIIGIFVGPYVFNFVPESVLSISGIISNFALSLIAFSIGQNFSRHVFVQIGRQVLWISILAAFGAWLFVVVGLVLLGLPLYVSLIFGAIATATAPAALIMVVRQYRAKGRFTEILMGVVAIDDAWGLILFSICLAFARRMYFNQTTNLYSLTLKPILEIGGSFILGGGMGVIFSLLSKHIKNNRDSLIYTLGLIMLTAGIALHFHLSVLLACMLLSATIVNLKKENFRFFEVLQTVDWPIYLLFFVLAGANLEINNLVNIGYISIVYIVARMLGKFLGTYLGAVASKASKNVKRYLALAQMPQAGVALGMALIAKSEFPEMGNLIFTAVMTSTIIYEIFGPYCVKIALQKSGQIPGPGPEVGKEALV